MISFIISLITNGGIVACMWYGLQGVSYLYDFGYTASWILVVLLGIIFASSHTDDMKEEFSKLRNKKDYSIQTIHSILWDVPIVYLLITGGHPVFSAFYVMLHLAYYGNVLKQEVTR